MSAPLPTLPIATTISNGLALMYYDPVSETLKEITDSVHLAVYPYESTIRRFYLCGDILYLQANLTVTVSLDSLHRDDYTAKVLLGSQNPRKGDFTNATNIASVYSFTFTDTGFSNALAVDILLTSNLRTETSTSLNINITADDAI